MSPSSIATGRGDTTVALRGKAEGRESVTATGDSVMLLRRRLIFPPASAANSLSLSVGVVPPAVLVPPVLAPGVREEGEEAEEAEEDEDAEAEEAEEEMEVKVGEDDEAGREGVDASSASAFFVFFFFFSATFGAASKRAPSTPPAEPSIIPKSTTSALFFELPPLTHPPMRAPALPATNILEEREGFERRSATRSPTMLPEVAPRPTARAAQRAQSPLLVKSPSSSDFRLGWAYMVGVQGLWREAWKGNDGRCGGGVVGGVVGGRKGRSEGGWW